MSDQLDTIFETLRSIDKRLSGLESQERPVTASGTWTPSFAGTGGGGSMTYAKQLGRYVRVGDLVYIWCDMTLASLSSAPSGNLIVSGLPFTSANNGLYTALTVSYYAGISVTVDAATITPNTANFGLLSANAFIAASNLTSSAGLTCAGAYLVV